MRELRINHCVDFDKYGVAITQPETLRATAGNGTVTIGIGVDPLTRREFTLTKGEARQLANWIHQELRRCRQQ